MEYLSTYIIVALAGALIFGVCKLYQRQRPTPAEKRKEQVRTTCGRFCRGKYLVCHTSIGGGWIDWTETYRRFVDPQARWSPNAEWRRDHLRSIEVTFFKKHPELDTTEYRQWWADLTKRHYTEVKQRALRNARATRARKRAHKKMLKRGVA